MRAFWPITCEWDFSRLWGLHNKTENLIFGYYQHKDKVLWKLKKTPFWTHFGSKLSFEGKWDFFWKIYFCLTFFLFLDFHLCVKFQKNKELIFRKSCSRCMDRWTNKRTDRKSEKHKLIRSPLHWSKNHLPNCLMNKQ